MLAILSSFVFIMIGLSDKYSFTARTLNTRNSSPDYIVNVDSAQTFKYRLDTFGLINQLRLIGEQILAESATDHLTVTIQLIEFVSSFDLRHGYRGACTPASVSSIEFN